MNEKLLYELEYEVSELRKQCLDAIRYNELSIKELLDLGFDNADLEINGDWYNLGYKWKVQDIKTKEIKYGYNSSDFEELNNKQLNCEVEYYDHELSNDNYLQVSVRLVNEEDKKYFLEEEDYE